MQEALYFISFVSVAWLLYSTFRILLFSPPPFILAVTVRLGIAIAIFFAAISLPHNPATLKKEYRQTVGYPSTRLTLQFASLSDAQKKQVVDELQIFFADSQQQLTVTQKKPVKNRTSMEIANPQRAIKTWHDTLPNRYRWQGNQLIIATGRPLDKEEADALESTLALTLKPDPDEKRYEARFVLSSALPADTNMWQMLLREEMEALPLAFSSGAEMKVVNAPCPKNMAVLCKTRFSCLLPVTTPLPPATTMAWLVINHDEPISLLGTVGEEKYPLFISKEEGKATPFLVLSADNREGNREQICERQKRYFMARHFSGGSFSGLISQTLESYHLERHVVFRP